MQFVKLIQKFKSHESFEDIFLELLLIIHNIKLINDALFIFQLFRIMKL